MNYLQDIARLYAEGNLSGLVDIKVARKNDFVSIPDPVGGIINGSVVFKTGKGWNTWLVQMESPRAISAGNVAREGPFKKNTLPFTLAKDKAGVRNMLELAERDELIVLFKDGNGQHKLFGLLYQPVRFQFSHDSGAQFNNLNAYSCQFYYEGPDNMFFYTGSVVPASGIAPCPVYWNGELIATLTPGESLSLTSDFSYTDFVISS